MSSDSTSELSDSKPSDALSSADSSVSTSKKEEVSTSKDDAASENKDENNVSTSKTLNEISTSENKEGDGKIEPSDAKCESDGKDEPKVNGSHTGAEPTVNGQSLNNEALSKSSSEASPKKEEAKAAVVKPVERPVPGYPTYPSYPSYPGYEAGYPSPNPAYPGSPAGYYAPQYSGYGHSGGYHPGYHAPAGYYSPAAYQQAYTGYAYTPGE